MTRLPRLAVALFVVSMSACGGAGAEKTSSSVTPPTSPPPTETTVATVACPNPDGSAPRMTAFGRPPPMCITAGRSYTAEVATDKGTFTITLDSARAPATVNNFVVLSEYHFYDGVTFHRIIPGFVVQGGDPLGTGAGGPGYRFRDELPRAGEYKIGSVAMANSGPNTNGSQFFIVTGNQGVALPPNYSLFGTVTGGMDVVTAIEATGTRSGKPAETTRITSIKISGS